MIIWRILRLPGPAYCNMYCMEIRGGTYVLTYICQKKGFMEDGLLGIGEGTIESVIGCGITKSLNESYGCRAEPLE